MLIVVWEPPDVICARDDDEVLPLFSVSLHMPPFNPFQLHIPGIPRDHMHVEMHHALIRLPTGMACDLEKRCRITFLMSQVDQMHMSENN